jgi:glyoxylase-like metal-dependent hydrolase (beta-lactamase superfamily II)
MIVDAVLDFDPNSGSTSSKSADELMKYVQDQKLDVVWIVETHAHADHLTAAPYLKKALGGKAQIGIGELITGVQKTFAGIYGTQWKTDGSQFDKLFKADEKFAVGDLSCTVMHAPGHTPDHLAYYFPDDALFTGDSIFMPDQGTARVDFPKGSAEDLWSTMQKILSLPPTVRVFVGHDYCPGGRDAAWETTVADQAKKNIHVKEGTKKEEFLEFRSKRDGVLNHPRLIIPAIQVNLMGGKFPKADSDGQVYLRYPINVLKKGTDLDCLE